MPDRLVPDTRDRYAHFTTINTRWMDNDVYGHVNNAVYYSWIDTAVNRLLVEQGLLNTDPHAPVGLVVRNECQYFQSISFPQDVEVGLRIGKLGTSSITYELGIFVHGSLDPACARATLVHVYVDPHTRRPCPLTDAHVQKLGAFTVNEAGRSR